MPENFVQKITYSAGDSNALIRDLRTEKNFRIAVTVTLVATGTDVKPLEVVLFMNDVKSDVLYTQMKGRGCRTLGEDKLREVTPNADNKSCFYIVDAVGVTESDKTIPQPGKGSEGGNLKPLRLDQLLEHLSHGEVSDDKLIAENGQFTPYYIWKNYKILDVEGNVEDLDIKQNIKALTHLIQLVRYAYHKNDQLVSLIKGYSQRFSLYCGQAQRELTVEQRDIMKQIADYIVEEGSISTNELNSFDTDLWRRAMKSFGAPGLVQEIITLSKFILKAA